MFEGLTNFANNPTGVAGTVGMATGNPWLGPAIGALGNVLGAFGQPGPQEQLPTNLVLSDPGQYKMLNAMRKAYMTGSGDFGFGSNVKQGSSQLSQFMADRGISQGSGYYGGAMGNMIAQAMSGDAQARRGYGMDLVRTPVQTAAITGKRQYS